jgi:hypothetical protein
MIAECTDAGKSRTLDVHEVLEVFEEVTRACESRPTKRSRRTRAEIENIEVWAELLLKDDHPMTVRQLYYRLVSEGIIDKTEQEYKTLVRLLGVLRREGELPFDWIADNTRWQRVPATHSSLAACLKETADLYRRDLWRDQDAYVEVWLEKDALSGVLYRETAPYGVPLMVCRGYASLSFLHGAAESIAAQEKPAYIYYFGDFDPSGLDISRKVEENLREFAPDADITFERVAVNEQQIETMKLPTRPTKKSDTRSRNFGKVSVEVDAIPPAALRALVRDCIENHIDQQALALTRQIEENERGILRTFAEVHSSA